MSEQYKGLSSKEAERLLIEVGENAIKPQKKAGALKMFVGQFRDALIMILLASTVLSVLMGEVSEAFTIIAIVLLNAILGFVQEFKTERTLEKLGELSAPTATVVRDGQVVQINSRELVPGDVVYLRAGDRVPADGRILEENGLSCDESMLSGESAGVEKQKDDAVYMGTLATAGKGIFLVTETGPDTQMGGIAGMLGSIEVQQTPLQKRLAQLSGYIGVGCLVICAVVALTGILRGEPVFDMLLTGISLSVAAVPEGLPAIVTIALALAVGRMVKRNALVRRLHAVETLGCANVICSDKTGTLTENKMTVKLLWTMEDELAVDGSGYDISGGFTQGKRQVSPQELPGAAALLHTALLCNNATLSYRKEAKWRDVVGFRTAPQVKVYGEPTEAALLVMAAKAGLQREDLPYTIEKEFPFDSTRKMMSVLARGSDGNMTLFVKGAPDVLLDRCTHCMVQGRPSPMTPAFKDKITRQNTRMAEDALRVLGFAMRRASSPADLGEDRLVFVGLAGLLDPPRKEAAPAVRRCREAHIKPVMITGDHAITARAIAKELKIYREGDIVLTGKELDALSEEKLVEMLPKVSVFARVTPAHKLRIVRAFKSQGNIVAMTGDGVNDAPAVKEADIGVSMGITGTDVTKEAASVILMDDNFATLVAAVEEGRVIYQNIRKFIRYLLSCNIGEVFTMFFAMLLGMPVPLLPIQILLINLATDGLPAVALGLEPAEDDVMKHAPRRSNESIFSGGLGFTIVLRGLLIGLTTLGVFLSIFRDGGSVETARTAALLALVTTQLIHVFECKSEHRSLFGINPFNNIKLVGAVAVSAITMYFTLYNPIFNSIFYTVPLDSHQLATVFGYCAIVPIFSGIVLAIHRFVAGKQVSRPTLEPAMLITGKRASW
ncbi:MAG: cation-translocating P-type ATPase [Angelakisella sp.]|nr:cation-translocating P-type ATPase [Angelakisella sp.]